MSGTRLRNVNLLVAEAERAKTFYAGALGLSVDERRSAPPHMLILGDGAAP